LPRPNITPALCGTLAYAIVVVVVLILPASKPHPRGGFLAEYYLSLGRRAIFDIASNVLLFAPLGWGLHRVGRLLRVDASALGVAVGAIAGLFSLTMESVQYFMLTYRYSSIVDVATNTAGALIGALAERISSNGR
jgi:glycopeptide antibiotics resistance protein